MMKIKITKFRKKIINIATTTAAFSAAIPVSTISMVSCSPKQEDNKPMPKDVTQLNVSNVTNLNANQEVCNSPMFLMNDTEYSFNVTAQFINIKSGFDFKIGYQFGSIKNKTIVWQSGWNEATAGYTYAIINSASAVRYRVYSATMGGQLSNVSTYFSINVSKVDTSTPSTEGLKVAGSIKSLLWVANSSGTPTTNTVYSNISTNYVFRELFEGDSTSNPNFIKEVDPHFLPYTTLSPYCYWGMFRNCTLIQNAPELPATSLTEQCYASMFGNCTSLQIAPDLPATILKSKCCQYMFVGCTNLRLLSMAYVGNFLDLYFYNWLPTNFANTCSIRYSGLDTAYFKSMNCYITSDSQIISHTRDFEIKDDTCLGLGQTSQITNGQKTKFRAYKDSNYTFADIESQLPSFKKLSTISCEAWYDASTKKPVTKVNHSYSSIKVSALPSVMSLRYEAKFGSSFQIVEGYTNVLIKTPTKISFFGKSGWYCDVENNQSNNNYNWVEIKTGQSGVVFNTNLPRQILLKGQFRDYPSDETKVNAYKGIVFSYPSVTSKTSVKSTDLVEVGGNFLSLLYGYNFDPTQAQYKQLPTKNSSGKSCGMHLCMHLFYPHIDKEINSKAYKDIPTYQRLGIGSISEDFLSYTNTSTGVKTRAFFQMFKDNKYLVNAPKLPAKFATDAYNVCWSMFEGCSSLTTLPSGMLPAITVCGNAYNSMFKNCTSLTTAPELPATTIGACCYADMFKGCSKLKNLPSKLPATTLAEQCYIGMFSGCSSLTSIPSGFLPAKKLADDCYGYSLSCRCSGELDFSTGMFYGCSKLTTIPANLLPATTLTKGCYSCMFAGCSSLTSIPTGFLPATTLADCCYFEMFAYCSKLSSIPQTLLPATTLKESCYAGMFQWCTSLKSLPNNLLPAGKNGNGSLATHCYGYYNGYNKTYHGMFQGCTGLTTLPSKDFLSSTTLASTCYQSMFQNCEGLTSIPNNLLTWAEPAYYCYSQMFYGCKNLKDVPFKLFSYKSDNLAEGCYFSMFAYCSKLTSAPNVRATNKRPKNCCCKMFYYCSSLNVKKSSSKPSKNIISYRNLGSGGAKDMYSYTKNYNKSHTPDGSSYYYWE